MTDKSALPVPAFRQKVSYPLRRALAKPGFFVLALRTLSITTHALSTRELTPRQSPSHSNCNGGCLVFCKYLLTLAVRDTCAFRHSEYRSFKSLRKMSALSCARPKNRGENCSYFLSGGALHCPLRLSYIGPPDKTGWCSPFILLIYSTTSKLRTCFASSDKLLDFSIFADQVDGAVPAVVSETDADWEGRARQQGLIPRWSWGSDELSQSLDGPDYKLTYHW